MRQLVLARSAVFNFGWLTNPTLLLCVGGVLLPNAFSLGSIVAGIGTPPRTTAIFAYVGLALLARIIHPAILVPLYLAVVAYDACSTIALAFNLAPSEVLLALHLSMQLKVFQSPLYIAMLTTLGGLVGFNIAFLVANRAALRRGYSVALIAVGMLVAALDLLANTSPHYQFGTLYGADKPMESASEDSGFRRAVVSARPPRVLLVMVEALGQFEDPATRSLLLQPFRDEKLRKRYELTSGTTTYYGSTTAAEMRELCHTRESYLDFIADSSTVCLPRILHERGYQTIALHNFTSVFFDRPKWYPKLGFEKSIFWEDLTAVTRRLCGGPFRGPCDVDVIPVIAKELRQAKKPTFYYWLTLSTHVPIAPREGTPRLRCENGGGSIGHAEVCYMTELWLDLFENLARLAADLPPTEILIVGDHAPPLWSKPGRELFTAGKVPWIRLTPRSDLRVSRAR